jgi:hypothetical protein
VHKEALEKLIFVSRNAYSIVVARRDGKRPLGRPRHGWEDNIEMDHREIGWKGMDWMHLTQDRDHWRAVVSTVMNFAFNKRPRMS